MITPTVGRVVWFYPHGSDLHAHPLAAIITAVFTETRVNLAIFSQEGVLYPSPPTSVLLVQEQNQRPESGRCFCTWMPYQFGQAAKAESLESLLASSLAGSGESEGDVNALAFGDNLRAMLSLKDFLGKIDLAKLIAAFDVSLVDDIFAAFQLLLAANGTKAKIEAGLALAHLVTAATKQTQADDKFVATVASIMQGPLLDLVAAIIDRWIAQKAMADVHGAQDAFALESFEALTVAEEEVFRAAAVDPVMVMTILKMLWDLYQAWAGKK